jgi:hypothetical protein
MTAENDYFVTWMLYLAASVGGLVVVWRMCQVFSSVEVRRVILLCCAAILWTPAKLQTVENHHWVPAFMAALMESMSTGSDAVISRGWPILLVMVVLLLLSIAGRLLLRQFNKGGSR